MRFIIHELPYERPLLAGQLLYTRDGQSTGAVESWRLTSAMDNFRFLRVDLDARQAPSRRSVLYHATLNPGGGLEQLKYRYWSTGLEVSGTLVANGERWLAGRTVNGVGYQDEARGPVFWFPAGVGLSLLRELSGESGAVTLQLETDDPAAIMAPVAVQVMIASGEPEMLTIAGETIATTPLNVTWAGNRRTVWLDDDGRPLRLLREDGLAAEAARLVRYG